MRLLELKDQRVHKARKVILDLKELQVSGVSLELRAKEVHKGMTAHLEPPGPRVTKAILGIMGYLAMTGLQALLGQREIREIKVIRVNRGFPVLVASGML
jgi:hypothetical protein